MQSNTDMLASYDINNHWTLIEITSSHICSSLGVGTLSTRFHPHPNWLAKLKYKLKFFFKTFNWFLKFLYIKVFLVRSLNVFVIFFQVFGRRYHFDNCLGHSLASPSQAWPDQGASVQFGALLCDDPTLAGLESWVVWTLSILAIWTQTLRQSIARSQSMARIKGHTKKHINHYTRRRKLIKNDMEGGSGHAKLKSMEHRGYKI